jgi:hypothetical protein
LINQFESSYVVPTLENQSEWVALVEVFWNDITTLISALIDVQNSSQTLLSSNDAKYLRSLDTSLNIPSRLALLDGTEQVSIQASHNGKFIIELVSAPYRLHNMHITVNNTYIDLQSIAKLVSTRLPDESEITQPLYIELLADELVTTIEIQNPLQPYVYTTLSNDRIFYLVVKESSIELRLTRNDQYHAFKVKPNATSIKFGFTGQYTPQGSPIYTSASELASILGGSVSRTTNLTSVSIVDGVCDTSISRCTAFLLDRNNEQIIIDGNRAYHYASTSLNYSGNVRLVHEKVILNSESGMIYSIPNDLLSSDKSDNIKTDLSSVISTGDLIIDIDQTVAEVLSNNTSIILDKKIRPSTCVIRLGSFDCWKRIVDGIVIPQIEFPRHTDSTTLNNLRYTASVIKSFLANIKTRITNNQLSRRSLMSILNPLNDLQRQHLAFRANRAADILFSGDIQSYVELNDTNYNYEIMLKSVIDETKARL